MSRLTHGFRIDDARCDGCLSCMRACPTFAIRVRDGKASYRPDQCVDCGACLSTCDRGAIAATTWSVKDLERFDFKVAVASPVLFGQFPAGITPAQIVGGLRTLGFDAVWDYAVEVGLVGRAIQRFVREWKGPLPIISINCPVVVRLVQVAYPGMVDRLIPVQLPREMAGREAKRRYSEQLGLSKDEIGAIYITPCQAKSISIIQPAEGVESHLDGSVGIRDVYNAVVAYASQHKGEGGAGPDGDIVRNASFLRWSVNEGLGHILSRHRYLHVTGLRNVMQVFDDIEKGKMRNVEFIEAYSCWSGCMGGNLTAANIYVTLSTCRSLISGLPEMDPRTEAEIERRYPDEDFSLERPILPRPITGLPGDLRERVQMMEKVEAILGTLPGLDCGLCGAPSCRELAKDIGIGQAAPADCLFQSEERLRELRKTYPRQGR